MPRKYDRIIAAFLSTPWAIWPEKLREIHAFFELKASGGMLTRAEINAIVNENDPNEPRRRDVGKIAILPIKGVIAHRAEQVDDISGNGGTSTEKFGQRFDQVVEDSSIDAIVLDVRSPGGTIDGVPELFAKIIAAQGTKPIVAVANAQAASAAFWLATAADEIVVTPSGQVGSIGIFAAHEDHSAEQERAGIKTTLIHAGKFKVEANPFEPLSEEARAALQDSVDEFMDMFVRDVARGRGVKVGEVRNGFGEGRMVSAKEAVRLGMADRVGTLEATIAGLQRPGKRRGRTSASARRRLALT